MDITGRKLFVKALEEEGVDTIFAYPGGTVTDLFDELYKTNSINLVLPRHEQGLIHEAEGYAKSTGKVGVCLVTSGPGATNTVTGLADAHYDNVPLVCFTGQVPLPLIGNDAFQEVDIVGITRNITKYSVTVHDRKDLGKIIKMAFHIARTGKPGPVLIDLPKDIQTASGPAEYPDKVEIRGYRVNDTVHVGQLKRAYKMLKSAKKPLILAGGGINVARANENLRRFVEAENVPVVTTIMGKGAIPTTHPLYVGNCGMHGKYAANKAVSECDLLFSIGTRFNDRITGDLNEFAPKAKIVHIDVDTASISRNVVVDVPIVADANVALDKLNEWAEPKKTAEWQKQIKAQNLDAVARRKVDANLAVAHANPTQNRINFLRRYWKRLGAAAAGTDKSGNPRCISDNVPSFIRHNHFNEQITWKQIVHLLYFFSVFNFNLRFFRNQDAKQIVGNAHRIHTTLQIFLYSVLMPGVGVNHVPFFFRLCHDLRSDSNQFQEEGNEKFTGYEENAERRAENQNFHRISAQFFFLRPANTLDFFGDTAETKPF